MTTLEKLNELTHKYFSEIIPDLQALDTTDYFLCLPELNNKNIVNEMAIARRIIPYNVTEKMTQNETTFVYHMSVNINTMLVDLTKSIGNLKGRKIHLNSPKQENIYFKDLEGAAGYELRLYVEKNNE